MIINTKKVLKKKNVSKSTFSISFSYHLMDFWVALRNSIAIRSHKGCGGHAVQVVVLWGVSGSLEHVQHTASDNKSAENVNEGDEGGGGRQALGGVGGVEPASHHQKTTLKN